MLEPAPMKSDASMVESLAREGSIEDLRSYLESCGNLDARSPDGWRVVDYCVMIDDTEKVLWCLNHGADERGVLQLALGNHNWGMCKSLIDHGVRLDLRDNDGDLPGDVVYGRGNEIEEIKYLLRKHGAKGGRL
jgi:hypothetical protein